MGLQAGECRGTGGTDGRLASVSGLKVVWVRILTATRASPCPSFILSKTEVTLGVLGHL